MSESYLNWCAMSGAEKEAYGKTHGFGDGKSNEDDTEG